MNIFIVYIQDDNSIVITTDLQLTFPTNYIDSVRKVREQYKTCMKYNDHLLAHYKRKVGICTNVLQTKCRL